MGTLTLLADDAPAWFREIIQPDTLALIIPICVIIGGVILALAFAIMRHRERIAKIEHGIDPDAKRNSSAPVDTTLPYRPQ